MKIKRSLTWLSQAVVAAVVVAGSLLALSPAASADTVYGTQSISYSGVANPPTSDKPHSKLWWNDGSWWADMWTTGSGWHIYRLDRGTHTWVDTGLLNDARGNTLADVLWDGTHLYIASHVVGVSTNSSPVVSVSGQPANLYRYSYAGGTYTLDAGFPTVITNNSSESMTIDEDSTGAIWATWTQVAGNSTAGYTNTVYVNDSAPGGTSWASPFVIPVSNPKAAPDDISAVVAFSKNKIGVMWSDQLTGSVWWATRTDGTSPTATSSWNFQPAIQGKGQADDHLNLKSLQADPSGRVFAAVKTSLNDTSTDPTLPQLLLLVFKPGTGAFTQSTISTIGDCVTRPQIVLDTQNNLVHAFQTAPPTSVSGCAYSGVAGSIYEKTASMDNPVFGSGRGTPIIQSASSSNMNDVTTTKQGVNATSGLVVMASDDVAKRYWFSDRPLGPVGVAPVASFTATPTSGTAPLNVAFTDTSTGSPTSWAWDFGDTGTSTLQNPTHSYAAAGTYTAKLTATNATGSASATATITVTAAGTAPVASFTATPTSGTAPLSVAFTDTSTGSPTSWAWDFGDGGTSTVQNPTHSYAAAGTYTAKLTATNATGSGSATSTITVTSSTSTTPLELNDATVGTGLNQFNYSGSWSVSNPALAYKSDNHYANATNANYQVQFSGTQAKIYAEKSSALGIVGVSIDGGAETMVDPYASTRSEQNLLYTSPVLTSATHTLKVRITGTKNASATGTYAAADRVEIITSGTTPPPAPAPVASFTATPTSGTAPLSVAFTDTSTGSPTSWAWDFGDGGTSTVQNPTHSYAAAGTYTAKLTATNGSGSGSATSTITVTSSTSTTPLELNDATVGTGLNQFNYSGSWSVSNPSLAYKSDNHFANATNASYQVQFSGTQAKIYAEKSSALGIVGVSIDGGAETMVDPYASTRSEQNLLYTSPVLTSGTHTLKVRITGTKNASATGTYAAADRVEILSN